MEGQKQVGDLSVAPIPLWQWMMLDDAEKRVLSTSPSCGLWGPLVVTLDIAGPGLGLPPTITAVQPSQAQKQGRVGTTGTEPGPGLHLCSKLPS